MIVECVDDIEDRTEAIELRQQANYWRAQHARAVQRDAACQQEVRQLRCRVREQEGQITELTKELEQSKARVAWLEQQVFGRKAEQTYDDSPQKELDDQEALHPPESAGQEKRKRGKQPGSKGYGRRIRHNLPTEETIHDLPEDQRKCPKCHKPFHLFPKTESSEEIEWEVVIRRRVHQRKMYIPTCDCQAVPGIVTAPCPPKLIPRGMFATSFWVRLLLEKFLFQRPLYRIRQVLALEGLDVSQGTLTRNLRQLGELLQPVYTGILERSRSANRWKMDETRWLVFEEIEGKKGYRWWLWVVITADTVVYLLEPTRSAEVPKNHLGEDAEGIITADRYSAYKALQGDADDESGIRIAFCWSHVRRDFKRIQNGYPILRKWGQAWEARINELFHLNKQRVKEKPDSPAFQARDQVLRKALDNLAEVRDRELADPNLHSAARKALESLRNHWEGCILFLDHPEISMDNNESERRLRNPVVGRKNYYGSGSIWSGAFTAICFTIFQTLLLNKIDPFKWLSAYFEACALNGGRSPEDVESFLPWNLSPEQKDAWYYAELDP